MIDNKDIQIGEFFDHFSEKMLKKDIEIYKTLAIHFGYYSKGIKTLTQAIINMNRYVALLLELKNKKNYKILDAGCGLGGTSIYLSSKFPKIEFVGISNGHKQINFANNFIEKKKISNVKFLCKSYLKTPFLDNSFDGIFALESASLALDHEKFIKEMKRILKPGGRLVIIDVFLNAENLSYLLEKIKRKYSIISGHLNLIKLSKYKKLLNKQGFIILNTKNLNEHIRRSMYQITFDLLKDFSKDDLKCITPSNYKENSSESSINFFENIILSGLLGIYRLIGYYSVVSIKKS